jgi:hypothetical protein
MQRKICRGRWIIYRQRLEICRGNQGSVSFVITLVKCEQVVHQFQDEISDLRDWSNWWWDGEINGKPELLFLSNTFKILPKFINAYKAEQFQILEGYLMLLKAIKWQLWFEEKLIIDMACETYALITEGWSKGKVDACFQLFFYQTYT